MRCFHEIFAKKKHESKLCSSEEDFFFRKIKDRSEIMETTYV